MAEHVLYRAEIDADLRMPDDRIRPRGGDPGGARKPRLSPQVVGVEKGDIAAGRRIHGEIACLARIAEIGLDHLEIPRSPAFHDVARETVGLVEDDEDLDGETGRLRKGHAALEAFKGRFGDQPLAMGVQYRRYRWPGHAAILRFPSAEGQAR